MENKLDKFKKYFDSIYKDSGPHEATFGLLEDLAREDDQIMEWIRSTFDVETSKHRKEDLANIATSVGEKEPYRSFLVNHCDWTSEDFED